MILLTFYLFFFFLAKPIQAQEVLFSDNFDSGDLNSWLVVRNAQQHHPEKPCYNSGEPAAWEIIDGQLGIDINSIACTTEIIPQDFNLTDVKNYEFEFDWNFSTSTHMDRNVLIKWQNKDNWYGLHIVDDKLIIQKVIAGRSALLDNEWGKYQFEADQTYHFKITIFEDLINVWIDDEQVITSQDRSPFITGFKTLGLQASSGSIFQSSSWFDNIVVNSLDESGGKKLNVSLYKQNDLQWKNDEYDSAEDWGNKSGIGNWGCALTSAVMVLDYYKIDQLPSGEKLTPASLNDWLNSQNDGYIGEGLINWMAITRLTDIMSESLETPVLEYQRFSGNLETAIAEIDKDQPVVLQIPGHFLVADGYNKEQTDLFIKDPAYKYSSFSEHEADLLSVRSFKPSYTDLSYILIVYDPELEVTLIDESQQVPLNLQMYTEYLEDDLSQETTPVKTIQSLGKPAPSNYLISVKNNSGLSKMIEVYAYDAKGQVSLLSQEVIGTKLFELEFSKTEVNRLTEITNQFTLFRELLRELYITKDITTKYAYLKLDELASYAEASHQSQIRYQLLISKTIHELREFLPDKLLEFIWD